MKKRALLLFLSHQQNVQEMILSAKYLQEKFNFEIISLYVRDIDIFIRPTFLLQKSLNGGIVDKNRRDAEDKHIKKVSNLLVDYGILNPLTVELGIPEKLLLNFLKITDLLILGSNLSLSEEITTLLKETYKPTFIIKDIPLCLDKIVVASDDGIKINKSLFKFMNVFPEIDNYNILAYNSKKKQMILDVMEYKNKNYDFLSVNAMDTFCHEINKNTCLIMGNLSKSYFFKKITKRKGLDIMENIHLPIFIS
ncbi:MAG: hypothetical protein ACRC0W_02410 [Cetobacterium sp.]